MQWTKRGGRRDRRAGYEQEKHGQRESIRERATKSMFAGGELTYLLMRVQFGRERERGGVVQGAWTSRSKGVECQAPAKSEAGIRRFWNRPLIRARDFSPLPLPSTPSLPPPYTSIPSSPIMAKSDKKSAPKKESKGKKAAPVRAVSPAAAASP